MLWPSSGEGVVRGKLQGVAERIKGPTLNEVPRGLDVRGGFGFRRTTTYA